MYLLKKIKKLLHYLLLLIMVLGVIVKLVGYVGMFFCTSLFFELVALD